MSSVVFPLFFPEGFNIPNAIIRAQVAIILFTAAYIAEVVRGGLQAIARGQYEAAESLGLNYYLTMRLIILPQALKIVIPPSVSILISAFKDTSLVVIIALFDFLKTTKTVISDPQWMGFSAEAYIFAALDIFFVLLFYVQLQSTAGTRVGNRFIGKNITVQGRSEALRVHRSRRTVGPQPEAGLPFVNAKLRELFNL